jgi:hypothetical protein
MRKEIKVAKAISTDIRCRNNADILRAIINSSDDVTLDFSDVVFVSRSFADELCDIIEHTTANVKTCNTCSLVTNMLKVVSDNRNKKRTRHIDNSNIFICKDMQSLANVLLS